MGSFRELFVASSNARGIVVDTSPKPEPAAGTLAGEMGARSLPLPYAEAASLTWLVRAATATKEQRRDAGGTQPPCAAAIAKYRSTRTDAGHSVKAAVEQLRCHVPGCGSSPCGVTIRGRLHEVVLGWPRRLIGG